LTLGEIAESAPPPSQFAGTPQNVIPAFVFIPNARDALNANNC
jgi:hypothetical protein